MKHEKRARALITQAEDLTDRKMVVLFKDDQGTLYDNERELTAEEIERLSKGNRKVVVFDWQDRAL